MVFFEQDIHGLPRSFGAAVYAWCFSATGFALIDKIAGVERKPNSTLRKEIVLNGGRAHAVDWKQSAECAVEAFQRGHLFVFIDEEQISPHAAAVVVPAHSVVRFVRVVPLVGG